MRSSRTVAILVAVAALALAGCSAISGSPTSKGHGGKNHRGGVAVTTPTSSVVSSDGVSSGGGTSSASSSDTSTTDPFASPTTVTVPNTLAPTSTPAAAAVATATLGKHRGRVHVAHVGGSGRGGRRAKKGL